MYTYETKQKQGRTSQQQDSGTARQGGLPNSALRSMTPQGERSGSDLGARMQSRLPAVPVRAQAQIPQAEAEADRLSAGVHASSPEGVKADLGRKMGADFSSVRFHTGADAAAKANGMGARAFTSGADVYFGDGGFDPAIAAHELVHTAQQGMVDSAAATMSTPVGGVQMTRASRKNHDAILELYEALQDGTWDALSEKEKNKWILRNPVAYGRLRSYVKARDKAADKSSVNLDDVNPEMAAKVKHWTEKRAGEENQAAAFLADMNGKEGAAPTSMLGGGSVSEMEDPSTSAEDGLDTASDVLDNSNTALGVANGFQGVVGNVGEGITGGIGGGLGIVTGGYGAIKAIKDTHEARKAGDGWGVADGIVDTLGNLANVAGGIVNIADAAGAGGALGAVGAGLGVVSGGISMYQGSREVHQGRMKSNAMSDYMKTAGDRNSLEGDDLVLRDIAAQGKMEGTRQKIEGSGQIVTGAMDAGSAILSGIPTGGTAIAGAALGAVSAGTKAAFAGANAIQQNRMTKKVVEQTSGITDAKITEFMQKSGIKDRHRAKQALMKALGYSSGTRAELYADQTEKRGEKLAELANARKATDDAASLNGRAETVAQGLGVDKGDQGYDAGELSKAMGLRESRSAIASRSHRLKAMKAADDAKKEAARQAAARQAAAAAAATP